MFSDNLSVAGPRLRYTYNLSHEATLERCERSSRCFAEIARGKASPTILPSEKLCIGYRTTYSPSSCLQEILYRIPISVTEVRCFRGTSGLIESH